MKEQRNKYIKVRMTLEEVRAFKEKSAEYKTVSHYVRKALEEYSNVSVRRQLELMQELGSFTADTKANCPISAGTSTRR